MAAFAVITEAFTGQTADVVSDEYDFMYREYHSTQGRWISPDPAGMSAVTLGNPQSWNRYAYVINNPLSLIDPSGLDFCIKALLDAAGNVMACFDEPGDLGHRGNFWGGWGPGDFGDGGSGVGFNGGFSGGPSGSWGEQPPVPLAPSPLIPANIMQILNFVLFNQPLDWNSVLWGTNCIPFCDVGPPANRQQSFKDRCLAEYYNSTAGRGIDFGSVLGLVPGWSPNASQNFKEIATLGTLKYGGLATTAAVRF